MGRSKTFKISSGFEELEIKTISNRGLNTSLPSCVHPDPINRIFYPDLNEVSFWGKFQA